MSNKYLQKTHTKFIENIKESFRKRILVDTQQVKSHSFQNTKDDF